LKERLHGLVRKGEHRARLLGTGRHHGPDPLAPPLTGGTPGSLRQAPVDGDKTDGLLRQIVGGLELGSLDGTMSPHNLGYVPKDRAYELLRQETGQDFGYDVKLWREWLKGNMVVRLRFQHVLQNRRGEFAPENLGYLPKEWAYRRLKGETGQDFGFDAEKWQEWLWNHPDVVAPGRRLNYD
jgi:hypothetical protein